MINHDYNKLNGIFDMKIGHGGRLRDDDGDEADGYDETLIPLDYESAGQIRDDDLLKYLVVPMQAGVFVTSVMDCCHSGTVLDLPYQFKADGESDSMQESEGFQFDSAFGAAAGIAAGIAAGQDPMEAALSECCSIS